MRWISILLLLLISCNKEDEVEESDPSLVNAVVIKSDETTFSAPISFQQLEDGGTASVYLQASSNEVEITLQAQTFIHNQGAGIYFLSCCDNSVVDKSAQGAAYDGIQTTPVNSIPAEKGRLQITTINSEGYTGSFSFTGRTASGVEKTFTGTFKVVY
ncbi:MAG TPA: hypothetical protein VEZ55_01025 [Chitinophagaceae bacterium]|jgi:hypothetical protein|nr:hypothetical protein [Chitinophagaceae bacterium]